MRRSSRAALIIIAAILFAFFLYIGMGIEFQLGNDDYNQENVLARHLPWVVISSALTFPLWISAIYRPSHPTIASLYHWANIALLLALAYFFGRVPIDSINRNQYINIINTPFALVATCYLLGLLVILFEMYKPIAKRET